MLRNLICLTVLTLSPALVFSAESNRASRANDAHAERDARQENKLVGEERAAQVRARNDARREQGPYGPVRSAEVRARNEARQAARGTEETAAAE